MSSSALPVEGLVDPLNIFPSAFWNITQPVRRQYPLLATLASAIFKQIARDEYLKNSSKISKATFKEAVEFFYTGYPSAEDSTPLIKVVHTLNLFHRSQEVNATALKIILTAAFRQHLLDPLHWVSHGFNHALNVADCLNMLFKQNETIRALFKNRYPGFSVSKTLGCLHLLAYFHDSGYPELNGRCKGTHAICSADLLYDFKKIFKNLVSDNQVFSRLYADFYKAIFSHNADVCDKSFEVRHEVQLGTYLYDRSSTDEVREAFSGNRKRGWKGMGETGTFPGRTVDLQASGDSLLGVQQDTYKLGENPFRLLHLADNFDLDCRRFMGRQKTDDFQNIYRHLHNIAEAEPDTPKRQRREKRYAKFLKGLDDTLSSVASKLDAQSIWHFGGCEAVQKVVSIQIHGAIVKVEVAIDDEKWLKLEQIQVNEGDVVSDVARFQFHRAALALNQVTLNGKVLGHGLYFVKAGAQADEDPLYPPKLHTT